MSDFRVDNTQRTEVLALLTRALDAQSLPLDEYDRRVVAVGSASHGSQLAAQLTDLPPEYAWHPAGRESPDAPAPARGRPGRTALILGLISIPMSVCAAGWIFGILAVMYSRRGGPVKGFGSAMIGRITGILGILLSAAAAFAFYLMRDRLGR